MIMLEDRCQITKAREKALAEGIKEVAAELRLIDVADLIAFIRIEQFANLANLVNSSTELHFKQGTILFGASADANCTWGDFPTITLDMEFHHMRVSVYFRLHLEALNAGVEITYITFDGMAHNPAKNTEHLIAAIKDARLSPVQPIDHW